MINMSVKHPNVKNRIVINKWDKFWRLTFIEETSILNRRAGRCICDCWNIVNINLFSLKNSNTKSCWCLKKENLSKLKTIHWLSKHRLYSTYRSIITRCTDDTFKWYKNYWGRGIKCEWKSFEEFLKDMWESYKEWLTIDRINNDWNYCKENCRWATIAQQNRNRKSNIMIWDICLIDYCSLHNLKYVTIQSRIRNWWSIADSINITIKK